MTDTVPSIVMIVASDSHFIYLMRYYTERSGLQPIIAPIDEKAAAVAEETRPAVIMLEVDPMLPSSKTVFTALKENGATREIPVVVCFWPEGGPCELADMADCSVEKPVSYEGFLSALREVTSWSA